MKPIDLQRIADQRLAVYEKVAVNDALDLNNSLDMLRLVCVAQQRQIEMLAGVLVRIAPNAYMSQNLAPLNGLPDLPDEEESATSGPSPLTESSPEVALARLVQAATRIREESFDKKAADAAMNSDPNADARDFYRKSMMQAAHEACAGNLRWVGPVLIMLQNWNEALDWAASILNELNPKPQLAREDD